MIRISFPHDALSDYQSFRDWDSEGQPFAIATYKGPSQIVLPDFDNGLTRMVYEGIAHSFLPPPNSAYHVLAHVELTSIVQLAELAEGSMLNFLSSSSTPSVPSGCVVPIECDRVILYLLPQSEFGSTRLDARDLDRRIAEVRSQIEDGVRSAPYGLGYLAEALSGPTYLHATLLGSRLCTLGVGPHFSRRR